MRFERRPLASRGSSSARTFASVAVLIVVIGLGALAYGQRFAIFDWVRLRNYDPPAEIQKLADETTMLQPTKRIFYANHPVIEPKGQFNTDCSTGEKTIVLGCYISGKGIFLYDVTDVRLQGVEQVTAAHEMLHAAYDRLSSNEKRRVNDLTAAAYAKVTDKRIRNVIEDYQSSGADVPNELHSILGTEVRNLPQELEDYYARYFSDRGKIVSFSEQYEQEFTQRQQKVTEYDKQLAELKKSIDDLNSSLPNKAKEINDEYARLLSLKNSGKISAYNAGVGPYNTSVNNYNASVVREQNLINQYNALVKERNAIALEENELLKAIDSRPETIETQ